MRVVFLDIDGPMIPSTWVLCHPMAAWDRTFPETTIRVMNMLCERSGARIVLNSTHNDPMTDAPDIVEALVAHGLERAHFHPQDPKTRCPALPRDESVTEWLARHPEVEDWIGYDDAVYSQNDNLIWVDPDSGLTLCHLNQALTRFGCRTIFIGV